MSKNGDSIFYTGGSGTSGDEGSGGEGEGGEIGIGGPKVDTPTSSAMSQGAIVAIVIVAAVIVLVMGVGIIVLCRFVESIKANREKARCVPRESLGRSATSMKIGLKRLSLVSRHGGPPTMENKENISGRNHPYFMLRPETRGNGKGSNVIVGPDGSTIDISRVGSIAIRSFGPDRKKAKGATRARFKKSGACSPGGKSSIKFAPSRGSCQPTLPSIQEVATSPQGTPSTPRTTGWQVSTPGQAPKTWPLPFFGYSPIHQNFH
ncbi:hypothetical protein MKZ38_001682 [Zalerion maritima]|uniref:Uncharacterized protein n=1 Tax=Zalerion maritima TaxID=339359 RepID=A0AAD5RQL6_9PEZI|nr:hypothetical protein MKZ38_001682 [Zalerion maritima]